jgi:hypothetical protein
MQTDLLDILPNFFILGAPKSGTTSLHRYLCQHPSIFIPRIKEVWYFHTQRNYRKGVAFLRGFYTRAAGYPLRGDATPHSFGRPEVVIPRFDALYGDRPLKFVVIFREPVARLWSSYQFLYHRGIERATIQAALARERSGRPHPLDSPGYLASGLYATHLCQWWQRYDREQFLLLLTDDLAARPDETVQRLLTFLGVDTNVPIDTSRRFNQGGRSRWLALSRWLCAPPTPFKQLSHWLIPHDQLRVRASWFARKLLLQKGGYPAMPEELVAELRAYYRDDVLGLQALLGRDLSHWLR